MCIYWYVYIYTYVYVSIYIYILCMLMFTSLISLAKHTQLQKLFPRCLADPLHHHQLLGLYNTCTQSVKLTMYWKVDHILVWCSIRLSTCGWKFSAQQLSHSASVAVRQAKPWCFAAPVVWERAPCFVALLGCGTEAGHPGASWDILGHPGTSWDILGCREIPESGVTM